jgi:hypothetical protein
MHAAGWLLSMVTIGCRRPSQIPQKKYAVCCRSRHSPFDVSVELEFSRAYLSSSETQIESDPTRKETGEKTMKVMVLVKASKESEAGILPTKELFAEMGKYNEELVKAGIMLAGEGLRPSSKGARVKFSGIKRTVIDGPFAETKELVAGFWLWQVRSMEEAVEWLKRAPFDGGNEVEIRQIYEAEDFGAEITPQVKEQEQRLREHLAAKK